MLSPHAGRATAGNWGRTQDGRLRRFSARTTGILAQLLSGGEGEGGEGQGQEHQHGQQQQEEEEEGEGMMHQPHAEGGGYAHALGHAQQEGWEPAHVAAGSMMHYY